MCEGNAEDVWARTGETAVAEGREGACECECVIVIVIVCVVGGAVGGLRVACEGGGTTEKEDGGDGHH